MSESINPDLQKIAEAQANLRQLAAALREAQHLEPETQQSLASLLDELGNELDPAGLATARTARLAEAVGKAARTLHEQKSPETLESVRAELADAAAKAEADAPVATGLVYQFIDVLASIGI